MIVSHRYRFIFLKTKKTGGTSLEIALSRSAGPRDVITPFGKSDEVLRRQWGGRGPQNYLPTLRDMGPRAWQQWGYGVWHRLKTGRFDRHHWPLEPFRQHMDAASVRQKVGPHFWDTYMKFAVERNPWDRAVSTYFWKTRKQANPPSFREFVLSGDALTLPRNYDIYSIRNIPAADHVIDYGLLDQQLPVLIDEIGLPDAVCTCMDQLRAKGSFRPDQDYRRYYDEDTRQLIEWQFAQEIALMGYRF